MLKIKTITNKNKTKEYNLLLKVDPSLWKLMKIKIFIREIP